MHCVKCGRETGDVRELCDECVDSPVRTGSRKISSWIVVLCIILFSIVLSGGLLLNSAREKSRRMSCRSILKSIGLCCKQYAMDYSDFFPVPNGWDGLEQLRVNDYLTDYGIYTCPSTTTVRASSGPLTKENCDYIYFGGFTDASSGKPGFADTPLMCDRPGNHRNYFSVLFRDGRVEGVETGDVKNCKDLIVILNKQYKYSPEHLKVLMEKADQLDKKYNPK